MREPITLQNLTQHQHRFIKQAVPALRPAQTSKVEAFLKQTIQLNTFGMCVPIHAWKDILQSNVLKNQIELCKRSICYDG